MTAPLSPVVDLSARPTASARLTVPSPGPRTLRQRLLSGTSLGTVAAATLLASAGLFSNQSQAACSIAIVGGSGPSTVTCSGSDSTPFSSFIELARLVAASADPQGIAVTIDSGANVTNNALNNSLGTGFTPFGTIFNFTSADTSVVTGPGTQVLVTHTNANATQSWAIGGTIESTSGSAIIDTLPLGGMVDMAILSSGQVLAFENAINIASLGAGAINITNAGRIEAGGYALAVAAGGAVNISNDDGATILGAAAVASANESVTFLNNNGSSWAFTGISLLGAAGDVSVINAGGSNISVGPFAALAMLAGGDAKIINEEGSSLTLDGFVGNLMIAGNDATIYNGSAATMSFDGVTGNFMIAEYDASITNDDDAQMNFIGFNGSLLQAGNEATLNNTNGGVINFFGLNVVNLQGNTSAVYNSAEINVLGVTSFIVDDFNNAGGVLDMQTGLSLPFYSTTAISGNFNGGPNGNRTSSTLEIDAALNGPSEDADQLRIYGNVTGSTGVIVADDLFGQAGTYNPEGVIFARVGAGGTTGYGNGDFLLVGGLDANGNVKPGPIDKGLFSYDIFLNPDHPLQGGPEGTNSWVLASTPDQTFFELPSIVTAAQDMWQLAAGAWLDRTADLRSQPLAGCGAGEGGLKDAPVECDRSRSRGMWAKGFGFEVDRGRNESWTNLGRTLDYTVDSNQSIWGVMGGLDIARSDSSQNGQRTWMFGVMGGYLGSDLDFDNSTTRVSYETGLVGAYATYLNGPWFVDGQFLANLGTMDYATSADQGLSATDSSDVASLGAVIDTGYRITHGSGFIEPGATIAYVNTDVDDINIYNTGVAFDGESFRGRLGLRLGTSYVTETTRVEPFIGGGVWYEFLGDNQASLQSGGFNLVSTGDVEGAIGELSGGLNMFSLTDGVSGFIKGTAQWGEDDYQAYGGQAGLRINW